MEDIKESLNFKYKNEEILLFFRKDRVLGKVYRNLIKKVAFKYLGRNPTNSISEYKGQAVDYIDLNLFKLCDLTSKDYDIIDKVIDIDEIILRERYFRTQADYYESYELIILASKFFIEYFRDSSYKIIIGQIVDNYVMDVMVRIAGYFDINYIGIVRFFYPGYVRITTYGEYNYLRDPSNKEVDAVLKKLLLKKKTVFLNNKYDILKNILKYYFIYKAKFLFHYIFYSKILRKREYEYISTKSQVYPKSINDLISTTKFKPQLPTRKGKPVVYIPLHYYPEATVEYWCPKTNISSYYPYMYKLLSILNANGFEVIVKEHPAMYSKRDSDIIQKINSFSNVTIVSPFISTFDIFDDVDFVLVWTGTTGIEAFIHNKIVISVSDNYYNEEIYNSLDDMFSNSCDFPTQEEKESLIKRVLSNCLEI